MLILLEFILLTINNYVALTLCGFCVERLSQPLYCPPSLANHSKNVRLSFFGELWKLGDQYCRSWGFKSSRTLQAFNDCIIISGEHRLIYFIINFSLITFGFVYLIVHTLCINGI